MTAKVPDGKKIGDCSPVWLGRRNIIFAAVGLFVLVCYCHCIIEYKKRDDSPIVLKYPFLFFFGLQAAANAFQKV